MGKPEIKDEVAEHLRKLKSKKAAGPDGLKSEMYKIKAGSKICVETLTECYRREIKREKKTEEWKLSITKIITKTK